MTIADIAPATEVVRPAPVTPPILAPAIEFPVDFVGEAEANDIFMEASRARAAASSMWELALALAQEDDLAWIAEESAWRAYQHAQNLWWVASDLRDSRFGRVRHQARERMLIPD